MYKHAKLFGDRGAMKGNLIHITLFYFPKIALAAQRILSTGKTLFHVNMERTIALEGRARSIPGGGPQGEVESGHRRTAAQL